MLTELGNEENYGKEFRDINVDKLKRCVVILQKHADKMRRLRATLHKTTEMLGNKMQSNG